MSIGLDRDDDEVRESSGSLSTSFLLPQLDLGLMIFGPLDMEFLG